jgi:hypothetical protein
MEVEEREELLAYQMDFHLTQNYTSYSMIAGANTHYQLLRQLDMLVEGSDEELHSVGEVF